MFARTFDTKILGNIPKETEHKSSKVKMLTSSLQTHVPETSTESEADISISK